MSRATAAFFLSRATAAFFLALLRGVPAPPFSGQDLDAERRRPRTRVVDFIEGARPWEDATPGVQPDPERLGPYPADSYRSCPEFFDVTAKWREAATSPEMIEYLQGEDEGGTHRNPGGERIPDEHRPYYGRRWRGRESDVVWAANELKSKGFVTLRNVVPVEEVAALRDKAEDSWCAIARALHAKNLSHCLVWKLRHAEVGGKELEQPFGAYKDARKCAWHTKFTKEYVVHEPGALGSMEQVLGSESALVVGAHRRLLKSLWPLLEKIRPDFLIDERGFLRNQNPHGGYWHKDVVEWTGAVRGTSFSVFVALQDVNQENGVTMFVPWNGDYVAAPHLPAGSVLMYDTVGLLHRAGNHTPPVGAPDVARWVTWTTLVSEAHKEHLCPFQTGERSVFDLK